MLADASFDRAAQAMPPAASRLVPSALSSGPIPMAMTRERFAPGARMVAV